MNATGIRTGGTSAGGGNHPIGIGAAVGVLAGLSWATSGSSIGDKGAGGEGGNDASNDCNFIYFHIIF